MALLAIIGVTVALTITFTKGSGDDGDGGNGNNPGTTQASGTSGPSPSPGGNSEIASANDTGLATIITEDPTCAAWSSINDSVSEAETATGWVNHDFKVPATEWTPELRQAYETMSKAMGTAADESIALAKKTPHRVMRELYEQFIAYSREFVNSIAAYTEVDIHLANTAAQTRVAILYVCEAIKFKSAEARGVLIPDPAAPSALAELGDPNNPQRFMTSVDAQCPKWQSLSDDFHAVSKPWGDLDPNVPADKWSTEQHALVEAVIPVMNQYADDIESLGRNSSNPIIEDFAVLSSQYWRAYTSALPKYSTSDFYLSQVAKRVPDLIVQACQGFGG